MLSLPISVFMINRWLQTFAYKTSIGVVEFVAADIITAMIIILTVGYQALKASINNPVQSLRYE